MELDILTLLIRLSFANGFGVLLRKWMLFGEKLFVVNLGNWKGVGALRKCETTMVLVYGRL